MVMIVSCVASIYYELLEYVNRTSPSHEWCGVGETS